MSVVLWGQCSWSWKTHSTLWTWSELSGCWLGLQPLRQLLFSKPLCCVALVIKTIIRWRLYYEFAIVSWQPFESSPLLQRDASQMSCINQCKLAQIDCSVLIICLHLLIRHQLFIKLYQSLFGGIIVKSYKSSAWTATRSLAFRKPVAIQILSRGNFFSLPRFFLVDSHSFRVKSH